MDVRDSNQIVDHKDRDHRNNRQQNLRISDYTGKGYNRKVANNNKSVHKGVARRKDCCKWVAYINLNKKRKPLGTFIDLEEAIATRKQYEKMICHGWHLE